MTLMYLSFSRTELTFIGRDQGSSNTCNKSKGACRQTFTRQLAQTLPAQVGFTNMRWWTIPTSTASPIFAACKTGTCDINWKPFQVWQRLQQSVDLSGSIR